MITPVLCNAKMTALKPFIPEEVTEDNTQNYPVEVMHEKPIKKVTGKIAAATLLALLSTGALASKYPINEEPKVTVSENNKTNIKNEDDSIANELNLTLLAVALFYLAYKTGRKPMEESKNN